MYIITSQGDHGFAQISTKVCGSTGKSYWFCLGGWISGGWEGCQSVESI